LSIGRISRKRGNRGQQFEKRETHTARRKENPKKKTPTFDAICRSVEKARFKNIFDEEGGGPGRGGAIWDGRGRHKA